MRSLRFESFALRSGVNKFTPPAEKQAEDRERLRAAGPAGFASCRAGGIIRISVMG